MSHLSGQIWNNISWTSNFPEIAGPNRSFSPTLMDEFSWWKFHASQPFFLHQQQNTKTKSKLYIYYIYICIHMVTDALLQKVDLVGEWAYIYIYNYIYMLHLRVHNPPTHYASQSSHQNLIPQVSKLTHCMLAGKTIPKTPHFCRAYLWTPIDAFYQAHHWSLATHTTLVDPGEGRV